MSHAARDVVLLGGFGRSGTGGVLRLLSPHPDIYATPYELRLLTDPDGLLSLESALIDNWTPWQADFAIDRFRRLAKTMGRTWGSAYTRSNYSGRFGPHYAEAVDALLERLVSFSYQGIWAGRATLLNKVLLRLTGHRRYSFNSREIFFAQEVDREGFHRVTREFIQTLYEGVAGEKGANRILINEPFVTQAPGRCMEMTGSTRLIVACRDPRDSFGSFQTRDWSPRGLSEAVEFQSSVHRRWLEQRSRLPSEQVLQVRLEDLAADRDSVVRSLEKFLGLEISPETIANTGFSAAKAHVGRWKKQFSEDQQKLVTESFREILTAYGYE
ncbi:MAG: sulfotransferase [Gemmatimonadota bacterium]|nr:sulfotransferase [Gemmatimonadota bacterium]MDP6529419.1 sulfotransferase [Gemmatimonadota bacterium]MDP6803264.1 sulfotransferase [Gemmatimonadota bacterium]MDP7032495.1 sulfotransferase [Gemmatimonadota bacterium]